MKCRIPTGLGIKPGINCIRTMKRIDNTRIQESEKAVEDKHEEEEDPENPSYGAGMF